MNHFDHITYTDSVSPKSFRCRPEPFPATLHWTPLVDTQPHHAGNPQCPFQSTETTSRLGPLDPGVTVSLLTGPHLRKQHEQRPSCCRHRESDTAYNVITLRMLTRAANERCDGLFTASFGPHLFTYITCSLLGDLDKITAYCHHQIGSTNLSTASLVSFHYNHVFFDVYQ